MPVAVNLAQITDPAARQELDQLIIGLQSTLAASVVSVGNWSPQLLFGGLNTGMVFSAAEGRYTKAGQFVMVQVHITLAVLGAAAGAAIISGLPYLCAYDSGGMFSVFHSNLAGIVGWPMGHIDGNKQQINLIHGSGGAVNTAGNMTNANFTATSDLYMVGAYISTT